MWANLITAVKALLSIVAAAVVMGAIYVGSILVGVLLTFFLLYVIYREYRIYHSSDQPK
jgi:uncharacterized membrane protein